VDLKSQKCSTISEEMVSRTGRRKEFGGAKVVVNGRGVREGTRTKKKKKKKAQGGTAGTDTVRNRNGP